MPRRKGIPKYRLHRARGLAVVTLDGCHVDKVVLNPSLNSNEAADEAA